jgi:hypothetical protein
MDEKLSRIGKDAFIRKKEIKEKLQKEQDEQYCFIPKINQISRQLGRSTASSVYSEESKNKKKQLAQASIEELQKKCSFSPRINSPKRFQGIVSAYKQGRRILDDIEKSREEKKKVILDYKQEAEVEAMNGCTFKPKGLNRVKTEGTVEVKGVERFQELRNMVKQQNFAKQERAKRLLYTDTSREMAYSPS